MKLFVAARNEMWHRHPAERVLFTESLHDVLLQAMNRRIAHVKETKRNNKHEVKLSRNFTSAPTSSFFTLLVFSSDYAQRALVEQIQFAVISSLSPLSKQELSSRIRKSKFFVRSSGSVSLFPLTRICALTNLQLSDKINPKCWPRSRLKHIQQQQSRWWFLFRLRKLTSPLIQLNFLCGWLHNRQPISRWRSILLDISPFQSPTRDFKAILWTLLSKCWRIFRNNLLSLSTFGALNTILAREILLFSFSAI